MDELKKQAEELGIKVDGRWSAERLQAEIDEVLAKEPEHDAETPEAVAEPEARTEPVEPEPEPELDAEAKAAGDAEIQADIQARFDASQAEGSVTVINLQENTMMALGLEGLHSEATLTAAQMALPRFAAKVQRAIDLGLIMVKDKAE